MLKYLKKDFFGWPHISAADSTHSKSLTTFSRLPTSKTLSITPIMSMNRPLKVTHAFISVPSGTLLNVFSFFLNSVVSAYSSKIKIRPVDTTPPSIIKDKRSKTFSKSTKILELNSFMLNIKSFPQVIFSPCKLLILNLKANRLTFLAQTLMLALKMSWVAYFFKLKNKKNFKRKRKKFKFKEKTFDFSSGKLNNKKLSRQNKKLEKLNKRRKQKKRD
jgi:hypothetical protein